MTTKKAKAADFSEELRACIDRILEGASKRQILGEMRAQGMAPKRAHEIYNWGSKAVLKIRKNGLPQTQDDWVIRYELIAKRARDAKDLRTELLAIEKAEKTSKESDWGELDVEDLITHLGELVLQKAEEISDEKALFALRDAVNAACLRLGRTPTKLRKFSEVVEEYC